MKKSVALLAAASLTGLSSCIYPPPPPPHTPFGPKPPFAPDPYGNDISPPPPIAPSPDPDPEPRNGEYPTAKPTANPNEVISPYAPYNVIDVTGFSSGKLARDPSNQKIFRVP